MKRLKRISPKSLGKVFGALYALLGLIFGLFFLVLSLVAGIGSEDGAMSMLFGIGAPILLPILYGVMGLVFGFITAWLYNFIAKKVGGIEVEVE